MLFQVSCIFGQESPRTISGIGWVGIEIYVGTGSMSTRCGANNETPIIISLGYLQFGVYALREYLKAPLTKEY